MENLFSAAALALPAAFLLDLILGDPKWLPHPIRWMGKAICGLEPRFRRLPVTTAASGALLALTLVAGAFLAARAALSVAGAIHPAAEGALEVALIYYTLSARCLETAARAVHLPLSAGDLAGARRALAMIVGRETRDLDSAGASRAAVETVAENLVDGVLAPLFFAAIGGAPLAMAYKMVNTLDSMIGYKNDAYIDFGRFAARLDDAANFIPARLSAPIISAAAALLGLDGRRTLGVALAQGRRHASPNAGFPEAAFAGALGVRLGGPSRYHGRIVDKPFIGEEFGEAAPEDIQRACALMLLAAGIGLFCAWLAAAGLDLALLNVLRAETVAVAKDCRALMSAMVFPWESIPG